MINAKPMNIVQMLMRVTRPADQDAERVVAKRVDCVTSSAAFASETHPATQMKTVILVNTVQRVHALMVVVLMTQKRVRGTRKDCHGHVMQTPESVLVKSSVVMPTTPVLSVSPKPAMISSRIGEIVRAMQTRAKDAARWIPIART